MNFLQLSGLAFLQGLTEFLPVSSSGHLILFARYGGFADQGISMDIALHLGSLLAVLLYFRKNIGEMLRGLIRSRFLPVRSEEGSRLSYLLLIASLPALTVGYLLRHVGLEAFRRPEVVGWTILLYGILLYLADRRKNTARSMKDLTVKDALIIGLAQCLALIPGTSRSGITITAARFLGMSRTESAGFSMLLSIPTILAASALEVVTIYQTGRLEELRHMEEAVAYSFAVSVVVIVLMMKWLKNSTYLPFVIYRIVLGAILIGVSF